MDDTNELEQWPTGLLDELEEQLLAVDIDLFWERVDAITSLVARGPLTTDKLAACQARAEAVLPPDLVRRLRETFTDPDGRDPGFTLRELLSEWEALRLDEEKLVGHLLVGHDTPAADVLGAEHDQRVQTHADLHRGGASHDITW